MEQISMLDTSEEYKAFVEKFKPKKTTDDCYTPPIVHDTVVKYVADYYGADKANFVRPFYPDGDYERYPYKPDDIVVDNPPFSILTKICKFYQDRKIPFFLYAPALTIFQSVRSTGATAVCASCHITYENGAEVNTSFVTNMEPETLARSAPELNEAVEEANRINQQEQKKHVPKYIYPPEVLTAAMLNKMSEHATAYKVRRDSAVYIAGMDEQRKQGKTIFGGGFLICKKAAAEKAAAEKAAAEKAAAEKAAAEKAAAEKAAATEWKLSEREKEMIEILG